MKTLNISKALPHELDRIYLMGFDIWGNGNSETRYLNECRESKKYKKGIWYVLKEGEQLLSSLIVYDFGNNTFGIGSIATSPALRKQGYASQLISGVIDEIEKQSPDATFFLYSDITPEFYKRFGFVSLPAEMQKYKTTICMIRTKEHVTAFVEKNGVPDYF
jgi:predicted acetyltransferase